MNDTKTQSTKLICTNDRYCDHRAEFDSAEEFCADMLYGFGEVVELAESRDLDGRDCYRDERGEVVLVRA